VPSYLAYGLGIQSALSLPELVPGKAGDVVIRLGKVDRLPPEAISAGVYSEATTREVYLFWEEVGAFLVRRGHEIIVEPAPGIEERALRLMVLGPALGVLLHQRGRLVLHASAVAIDGGAVAFLGGPGWGKSTTAAALHAQGHGIVADDVTAVRLDTDCPTVSPGFPQLKLWPEAAISSLGDDLQTLPRLHPELDKRARHVARAFPSATLPLRRIYVLAEGESQGIEPLQSQEALVELIRHSYVSALLQAAKASSHFLQCSSVVETVPIRCLRRPRSLPDLPVLARLVEEDLAQSQEHSHGTRRSS
jgi:hypothetical protein